MKNFHRIDDFDHMPPFFMSLVSASDIWVFLSSTGGLSAGRKDAENALFPYTTDDRITENAANTGPITLIRLPSGQLWQPFDTTIPPLLPRTRNLYKHIHGDALCFEERLEHVPLTFRYTWQTSDRWGLVRKIELENHGEEEIQIEMLDGVQNLLPACLSSQVQREFSNLLDAYKRNALLSPGSLALYALSSRLTDLAEPSEAMRCNSAWTCGWPLTSVLLCSDQVSNFRQQRDITPEQDICARRGAFLVHSSFTLAPHSQQQGYQVFEVNQSHADLVQLQNALQNPKTLQQALEQDLHAGSEELIHKIASADGKQISGNTPASQHHFSNVVYNCMRGGLFPDGPQIRKSDLISYLNTWRKDASPQVEKVFNPLPERISYQEFSQAIDHISNPDLQRICRQYLPLTFSRRHGDPSRPWNTFQINTHHPDGSPKLDFQGNWRDLFQNLEALLYSCPAFIPQVITCFLNATTADGYNPYRVTRDGIEWEKPEPENPWANIGYWGDHQIIYLLKLLEAQERFAPGTLATQLNKSAFSAADVPYRILPYSELVSRNDGTTVLFDHNRDQHVETRVATMGADGRMLYGPDGYALSFSLLEKMLVLALAKLGNLIPDGGIWMNTQRPEWNDANNALAGRGVSVVTLGYLHRYLQFMVTLVEASTETHAELSTSVATWMQRTHTILSTLTHSLRNDSERRKILDDLGQAASDYREDVYRDTFATSQSLIPIAFILDFSKQALRVCEITLRANRRPDGMYHAYHVLTFPTPDTAGIKKLTLMLEGQVSILSSGILNSTEALDLLQALRQSPLYRKDQHSYLLYPDERPAPFMKKNQVCRSEAENIPLLKTLIDQQDTRILSVDAHGDLHFNADFKNVRDLEAALKEFDHNPDHSAILALYENTFNHLAFTGRSGSMFGYEGLGSIYWHMVAKLLLAVQECYLKASASGDSPEQLSQLREAYFDVRDGLGFRKTAEVFGAFPTDPYSHTPAHAGAKQPGMTGQVKEEILTRMTELGLQVKEGCLHFNSELIPEGEWLSKPDTLTYINTFNAKVKLQVPQEAYAFTFNRVPLIIKKGRTAGITLKKSDGHTEQISGLTLSRAWSQSIFTYAGEIAELHVTL
ncbi:hypothetical protein P3T73_05845 [Kiritimatiellota bacterium B12222]|nr:hypothetical protein P3T73_05845 [Kiritimatiellota bacterium B12222]